MEDNKSDPVFSREDLIRKEALDQARLVCSNDPRQIIELAKMFEKFLSGKE